MVSAAFVDAQSDTSKALVLELGRRPAEGETTAQIRFGIGAAALLAGIAAAFIQLRRERAA